MGLALSLSLCLGFGAEFAQFGVCTSCGHFMLQVTLGFRCPNERVCGSLPPNLDMKLFQLKLLKVFFLVIS